MTIKQLQRKRLGTLYTPEVRRVLSSFAAWPVHVEDNKHEFIFSVRAFGMAACVSVLKAEARLACCDVVAIKLDEMLRAFRKALEKAYI